ncbi:hypothetical protein [Helicobacter trogontum]|uniref:Uncharacterized protein n=1 Tax=Helicobacter trogontum TaxID=50960 RepID=A0A4U8S9N0_9HELI|nr:hypothetical protein [Helicobacter trogontum]TLD82733.1 hypothetical protein LS81_006945 [Helicobacter trogontum]
MKKNLLSLFSFAVFTVYGSAIEASNILRDNDSLPYSLKRKVDILKRIGIEYCMERDNFKEHSFWLWHFKRKLELHKDSDDKSVNFFSDESDSGFSSFKGFVYSKTQDNILPRLYTCLELYESKEYQDEVERIVKKYCEECE